MRVAPNLRLTAIFISRGLFNITRAAGYDVIVKRKPMFCSHPHLPEVLNMVGPPSEEIVVGDGEDTIEQRVTDVAAVNAKILENISAAKQEFESRKRERKVFPHRGR